MGASKDEEGKGDDPTDGVKEKEFKSKNSLEGISKVEEEDEPPELIARDDDSSISDEEEEYIEGTPFVVIIMVVQGF